jgi:hypothetical protein
MKRSVGASLIPDSLQTVPVDDITSSWTNHSDECESLLDAIFANPDGNSLDIDFFEPCKQNAFLSALPDTSVLNPTSGKRQRVHSPMPEVPRPLFLDTVLDELNKSATHGEWENTSPQRVSKTVPLNPRRGSLALSSVGPAMDSDVEKREWLADNVIGVIETQSVSRLAQVQMDALREGRDNSLKFVYDERDELTGANCDGVFFSRDDLRKMSVF